jgi:Ca-activated chloride channel family protein
VLIGMTTGLAGCDKKEDRAGGPEARMDVRAGESYAEISENSFVPTAEAALSTFAIDVDTASYSNVRRFLNDGALPPHDAVRVEELINYFNYEYPVPDGEVPFSVTSEIADCPWNTEARLVHIGLQARELASDQLPARNLVFLLDVSGSMESPDKLPLLRRAMKLMVETLDEDDRVAIVVYAGAAGVVLEPTSGADQQAIMAALDRLRAGGSTNGGAGIERAYDLARQNFEPGAINRVILATDGDFNVGTTSERELERLIEHERESGVFLSVLGLGTGNLQDSTMELLADKGNGNYAYLDSIAEARKVLVEEAGGTLVTVAKDVKIQVEFDPDQVESYRLIGYENRLLDERDFEDDRKDAGEIGAGHSVTAMYEIVLADQVAPREPVAELRLRYRQPNGDQSQLITFPVVDGGTTLADSSDDFRFAAAVAEFGMLLRDSAHRGTASWAQAKALAEGALGRDRGGHRHEFLGMLSKAEDLD